MGWTMIESQTLGSSAASVTLGSGGTIPQTYKTLKLVISARDSGTSTGPGLSIGINGSTANFTTRTLLGNGSAASSYTGTNEAGYVNPSAATASTFSNVEIILPNYTGSTNKPFSSDSVTENNATLAYQALYAGLWSQTAAITSLVFTTQNSFVSGSSFTLYGLK